MATLTLYLMEQTAFGSLRVPYAPSRKFFFLGKKALMQENWPT
jgi:hypothetical protein